MTKPKNRRGGVSKLARTETVTIRLDSKLRYLVDLASRVQRRTVSSFIEWAVQNSLGQVDLGGKGTGPRSLAEAAEQLWDVDDVDRLVKLAFHSPHLLTYEEQLTWKRICESGYLWKGEFNLKEKRWVWEVKEECLYLWKLRLDWELFVAHGKGEGMDKWFLDKRGKYTPIQEHVYLNESGYFYVDDLGCVQMDNDGNIHINQNSFVKVDENGIKHLTLNENPKEFKPVFSLLESEGFFQQDKDGNVFINRRDSPYVFQTKNDESEE